VVLDSNVEMDMKKLMNKSIHLFVLGCNSRAVEIYKETQESKMVLYKKEKTKSLEKIFFNTFVKNVCNIKVNFQEYYNYFNKKRFGVKYIIIKEDELRYY
jgi:hypothetical protein